MRMDVVDFCFDGLHDFPCVSAAKHEHDSRDGFLLAVDHGRAVANGAADAHFRDVPDINRRAADFLHDDLLDVRHGLDEPDTSHDIALGVFLENVPACVGIVLLNCREDVMQSKVVFPQQARVHHDLVLFDKAPQRVDVHDVRQPFQERPDQPVLQCPAHHEFLLRDEAACRIILRAFQDILEDLAEAGGIGH